MNVWLKAGMLAFSSVALQTNASQRRILRTITSAPDYTVDDGPLVSVIIPAYNEEAYLPATLAALANQTYANIEVVVVDNLSTDDTVGVAQAAGARVVMNSEYNISMSRNMGAAAAQGGILLFLDADTVPESLFVEAAVKGIRDGYVAVTPVKVCTDSYVMSFLKLIRETFVPRHSSTCVAVLRSAFNAIGGFDQTCLPQENCSEEEDFYARLSGIGPISYLRFIYAGTSARRVEAQGLGRSNLWMDRAYREDVDW